MSDQPYLPTQNVPFSQEAEEAVIGSVLVNPAMFAEVSAFLKPDDFFLLRNNYIWQALERVSERRNPDGTKCQIDYLLLIEELRAMNRLDGVGGEVYIIGLFRNTPTSVHAPAYGDIVKRAATRRRLMAASDEIRGLALNENMAIEEVVENAEERLFRVTERAVPSEIFSMRTASLMFYDAVETRVANPLSGLAGISTGLDDLDAMIDGLQRKLYVVGGRPGMGKSALILMFALAAARAGKKTLVLSMEMEMEEIMGRIYAMISGIPSQVIKHGAFRGTQWSEFVKAIGEGGSLPLFFDDSKALSPLEVQTRANRVAHQYGGLDLLIIDGIYKMSPGKEIESRRLEIAHIASRLKDMTGKRELGIPIVATHQIVREADKRADKRPVMSDLKESGDVEQEADAVLLLYRDSVYNEASESPNGAEIIVAKQRDGATGTVQAWYEKSLTMFQNAVISKIDLSEL